MGDPAGVGPEIILKAFAKGCLKGIPLVIGDISVMRYYAELLKMDIPLAEAESPEKANSSSLNVLSLTKLEVGIDYLPAKSSATCGRAVVQYIKKAVELCLEGKASAMVTAPISKASMHQAGYKYPGHTELLAELTNTKNYAMMLTGGGIKSVLVTIHVPLKEVPNLIKEQEVYRVAKLTCVELERKWGVPNPKVAICGLNPHAGESGAFGNEEQHIKKAVERLKNEGYNVSGPHPADTVFYWHLKGNYHAVVAMYHDQGLIPVKLLGFDEGVNITLGLPIIRTSPDHGTAFDIAGKGVASYKSFAYAYDLAVELAAKRG